MDYNKIKTGMNLISEECHNILTSTSGKCLIYCPFYEFCKIIQVEKENYNPDILMPWQWRFMD